MNYENFISWMQFKILGEYTGGKSGKRFWLLESPYNNEWIVHNEESLKNLFDEIMDDQLYENFLMYNKNSRKIETEIEVEEVLPF